MIVQLTDQNKAISNKNKCMKKTFSIIVVVCALAYVFVAYYLLFRLSGREMVVMSADMLDNYNYGNAINLVPFKTIAQYVTAVFDGSIRGHALLNLVGNVLLFLPAGFFLPFFLKAARKLKWYSVIMASTIIVIEVVQLFTMSGSLDIDDFILNFAGVLIGFVIFTRTPARSLMERRAW